MASNVVVNILGDNSSLNRALDSSRSRSSKFGSALKSAMKVGALAVAGAAVVAGKALFDMTKGAIEDEAAQKKLAAALKNNAGATRSQVAATEKWISAQGVALGVADDDLRPALGRLVTATKDVGKAQKLTSLAMDVSAGSGASLETVTKALAKGYNGSVAGLAKFGISVKDAKGQTVSMEVAQRRLAAAFKGQAEKAANTTEGKFRRLKLQLSEMGETIGSKLIPVVSAMADWFLNKGLPAMTRFGDYLKVTVPPIITKVQDVVSKVFGGGKGGGIGGTIGGAVDYIKSVFRDGVTIVTVLWKHFGANIVGYAKAWFKSVVQILKGAFQIIRGVFKVFSSLLKGDWKGVWQGLKLILKGAANVIAGLVKNLWSTVKFAFKNAGVVLKAILKAAWDGLVNLAKAGASRLMEQVRALPGKIKDLGGKMLDAGKALIGKLFDGVKNAAGAAGGFVSDLVGKLKDGINSSLGLPLEINIDKGPFHLHATVIPALAKGGIVTSPTLALIGEAGPEAVVPLNGKHGLASGNTYVIKQYLQPLTDPVEAGRSVITAIDAYERAGGRVPAA